MKFWILSCAPQTGGQLRSSKSSEKTSIACWLKGVSGDPFAAGACVQIPNTGAPPVEGIC